MPRPWTCPYCPLRCDDLTVDGSDQTSFRAKPECTLLDRQLQRLGNSPTHSAAWVDGQTCERSKAIRRAAELIDSADRIVIRGTFPGFQTSRSALDFARKTGAILDHEGTRGQQTLRRVIARNGAITASLGDVRQHADVIVLVGQPEHDFPRLMERFVAPDPIDQKNRTLFSLGSKSSSLGSTIPIPLSTGGLGSFLASVRLNLTQKGPVIPESVPTEDISNDASQWAARLSKARYVAWIAGLDAFSGLDGEMDASTLLGLIGQLNDHSRAVLVAPDPSISFRQVALWHSGFSGPLQWIGDVPQPCNEDTIRNALSKPNTVLIQVGQSPNQDDNLCPPTEKPVLPKTILLSCDDPSQNGDAQVSLPVAAPAIDSADVTVRGDGSVTLPMPALRDRDQPTVETTLAALAASATPLQGIAN